MHDMTYGFANSLQAPASTRRGFIKATGLFIAGAGAAFALPDTVDAQDARVAQDIAVLNYALTLERLESDFYVSGLQRFGAADFTSLGGATLFDRPLCLRSLRPCPSSPLRNRRSRIPR